MLPTMAGMIAGCADSRMAGSNAGAGAQASGETAGARQPAYTTAYGISSDGPTTDLYTELFRANARDDKNAPATVPSGTVQQSPPAPAPAPAPGASSTTSSVARQQPARAQEQARAAPASPAPAAGAAQQETATAEAPTATAYGIPSNGPTTDLYTMLFGPKSRDQ